MYKIVIAMFIVATLQGENFVGRLLAPMGDVKVLHQSKTYKVFDRFKVYKDDVVYLDDLNASVQLLLYNNGAVLYNLKGKRVVPIKQFLFPDNKKPLTQPKTNISIKTDNAQKPYTIDKVQRQRVFIQED